MGDNEQKIKEFIQKHSSDAKRLEGELKKTQILGKRKTKKTYKTKTNRKNKFLSRKDKKQMGLYDLPRNKMKYEDALPMNDLWKEYMEEILEINGDVFPSVEDKGWENVAQLTFKADYHGAHITVLSSKSPTLTGISGICIIDTKNTFKLICADNIIRTIPKDQCQFQFDLGNGEFRIFGKHIAKRPAERAVKQNKQFSLSEL